MKSATILTNLDCNLKCSYCYEHNKCNMVANKEKISEFIEFFFKKVYIEDGVNTLIKFHIIGGEPFVHPEIIKLICDKSKEMHQYYKFSKKFIIYISTNGTLLNNKYVIDNIILPYKHNLHIGFSIDGNKESHDKFRVDYNGKGSWDKCVENLKLMLNLLGPSGVGCKCTYTHQTISDWFNGIKFLVDLGVDKINANNVSDESWPKEEAPILFDQFTKMVDYLFEKDLYDKVNIQQISSGRVNEMINFNLTDKVFNKKCIVCKSISTNYCLGVDNLIYPCHRFAATLNKNFSYGYLQNGSVIVTNQKLIDQINSFCGLENMSETCNKCDLKNMCYDCSEQYFIMNPEDPMFERNQRTSPLCAWTIASAGAKLYFKRVLRSCLNISEDAPDDIQLLKKQSEVK